MTPRATNGVRFFVLAVTAALAVGATHAEEMSLEERAEERRERFQLFNHCRPMYLLVEDLHSDADEIGLTKESLTAAVESRLRSARLYEGDRAAPYLYLNVSVVGQASNISLQYKRWMCHSASGLCGTATTWDTGGTGTHGDDATFVRSKVSEQVDAFLLKYLRVNEEYCPGN